MVPVGAGDFVSADCRLLQAFGVRVNAATVTGEALPGPPAKAAAPVPDEDVLRSPRTFCWLAPKWRRGRHRGERARTGAAVVFTASRRTQFGRLAHLTQTASSGHSPFLEEIARVSRIIAVIATSLGLSFFLIGLRAEQGYDLFAASIFAIGVIVANVPEGLLPTLTLALALGASAWPGGGPGPAPPLWRRSAPRR